MQRTMKLGLGAAVLAVAAHGGFWFYGTQQMQKQLAVYAAMAQQKGNTFTYEATPGGYPWAREVRLRNLVMANKSPTDGVATTVRIADGVVMSAGNGVTDRTLSVVGTHIPFEFSIVQAANAVSPQVDTLAVSGQIGQMNVRAPLMWNPANHNTITSRMQGLAFGTADKALAMQVGDVSQTVTTTPASMGSLDYRMVMSGIAFQQEETVDEQKLDTSGTVKDVSLGMALTEVNSNTPVARLLMAKLNELTATKISANPGAEHPVNETDKLGSISVTANTLEREGFMDFLLKLKMSDLTSTAPTMAGNINDLTCTLSYNNMPKALFTNLQGNAHVQTEAEAKAHGQVVLAQLVEAMIKDKMSLGVDECTVSAKGLTGSLRGMLSATEDGHPNVMLHVKASGDMVAGLNAMKSQMLPGAASGDLPAEKMDISVLTISNTLVMDGQPVMPLPRIQDVLGMAGAVVAPVADVTPTASGK